MRFVTGPICAGPHHLRSSMRVIGKHEARGAGDEALVGRARLVDGEGALHHRHRQLVGHVDAHVTSDAGQNVVRERTRVRHTVTHDPQVARSAFGDQTVLVHHRFEGTGLPRGLLGEHLREHGRALDVTALPADVGHHVHPHAGSHWDRR
jgi:hypothetical protein